MRLLPSVLAVLVLLCASACGSDGKVEVELNGVDRALAPATIPPDLALHLSESPDTRAAFANASKRTVMADGLVWEIRRADRLIGTLQLTTVLSRINLNDPDTRLGLVNQILSTTPTSIYVGDAEVYAVQLEGRASFVWFGQGLIEVVQLRDKQIDEYEKVIQAIVDHQKTQPAWIPLAPPVPKPA